MSGAYHQGFDVAKAGNGKMSKNRRTEDLVEGLLAHIAPKAKSLIVTVYGDAILPHGGTCWLGSLIRLVEPFGLGERIVRTSVFRLSKEEWLTSAQLGRRSYYSLTETGRQRFEAAHRRIYGAPLRSWDGEWTLVVANGAEIAGEARDALKRDLTWSGFGQIAPGIYAHPAPDAEDVRLVLQESGMADKVVILRANADRVTAPAALNSLIRASWNVSGLAADYQTFLDHFRPVWRALEAMEDLSPALCFAVRILLIHDYRRVLLRDPLLPEELLPPDWAGSAARLLCRNLYRLTQEPAERYLMSILETAEGPVPEAASPFFARFGGLIDPLPQEERASG